LSSIRLERDVEQSEGHERRADSPAEQRIGGDVDRLGRRRAEQPGRRHRDTGHDVHGEPRHEADEQVAAHARVADLPGNEPRPRNEHLRPDPPCPRFERHVQEPAEPAVQEREGH
jgi:hypothetical protein